VTVRFERYQLEDAHNLLADRQIFQTRRKFSWALLSAVINPIVAVRRRAHLAEPAKNRFVSRVDRDAAIECRVGTSNEIVAWER
jgi:hypothetical protein